MKKVNPWLLNDHMQTGLALEPSGELVKLQTFHISPRTYCTWIQDKFVQFSRSVTCDSLWPHGLQHARPPCPSPTPGVYPNSCPLSWWCHLTISSSFAPFSFCLQSFPALVFFNELTVCIRWPKCWSLFQQQSFQWKFRVDFLYDWLVWSCSPRDSQVSSSAPQFKSINSLALSLYICI